MVALGAKFRARLFVQPEAAGAEGNNVGGGAGGEGRSEGVAGGG